MTVYHRKAAVVVLLRHEAAGVLAKRAHLVAEGTGVADELSLVEDLVYVLDDLVSHLDAHAHVNRSRRMENPVLGVQVLEPIGAATSGGHDDAPGVDALFSVPACGNDASTTLLSRGNALNMLIIRLRKDKKRQLERAVFPVNNSGGGYCSANGFRTSSPRA